MDTDGRIDGLVSSWMEETAPTHLPQRTLDATFERTRESRQEARWRSRLRGSPIAWAAPVLSGAAVVVIVAGLATTLLVNQPRVAAPGPLPTTPDAWTRAEIELPSGRAGTVVALAASPQGLLAVVDEAVTFGDPNLDQEIATRRLAHSTDGRDWNLVPGDGLPSLSGPRSLSDPAVVGTARGFLMVHRNEVWSSADGLDWSRLVGPLEDPHLAAGRVAAVAVGGPGLVAVGSDNAAWFSPDGSDWAVAEVPPPPTGFFTGNGHPAPTVEMRGITVAGDTMLAWGQATAPGTPGFPDPTLSVLWTSTDGRSWSDAVDPEAEVFLSLRAMAAGPGGWVAVDDPGDADVGHPQFRAQASADGRSWDRAGVFDPDASWPSDAASYGEGGDIVEGMPLGLSVTSVAATSAGYVVVGGDGVCHPDRPDGPPWCVPEEAALWTSADGRAWTRLPRGEVFAVPESGSPAGAWADTIVAWGSRFAIGGVYDGRPAVWISGADGR